MNAAVIGFALLLLAAWPSGGGAVAVFTTRDNPLSIVAKADGRIVSGGISDYSVIAVSDDPQFVDKLYAAGAFLVLAAYPGAACRNN
jgi:hypothetical protein